MLACGEVTISIISGDNGINDSKLRGEVGELLLIDISSDFTTGNFFTLTMACTGSLDKADMFLEAIFELFVIIVSAYGFSLSINCGLGPDTGKLRFFSSAFKSVTFISSKLANGFCVTTFDTGLLVFSCTGG